MARGKGEGSIYRRKDGMWCMSVELPEGPDGRRRRKNVCRKDKAAVVREMRKVQQEVAKHGDVATSTTTVGKWMRYWIDDVAPNVVRPKTLAGYATVVNGYIIPQLGKHRLDKLTPAHVRSLHKTMQATPKDPALRDSTELPEDTEMLSSTYTLLAHNVLSKALQTAVRDGKLAANPCDAVDRPRKRVTEQKALTVDQAIELLAHLATRADGPLWAAYILTGARRGEILGLEADRVGDYLDLSWQLQRITDISNAPADWEYRKLGGTLYLTRPKSSAGWRVVPLVDPLKSILSTYIGAQSSGLVFTRDDKPWDPDGATKAWKALLAECGLPTDVVLHGARHTTVDLLYEAGVPEQTIMEIVGHSSRAVTRGYKSKGNHRQLADAMSSMSKMLDR